MNHLPVAQSIKGTIQQFTSYESKQPPPLVKQAKPPWLTLVRTSEYVQRTTRDRLEYISIRYFYCNMRACRFCPRIMSLTAWNTKRMFSVSVAVVKWWNRALLRSRRRLSNICNRKSCTSLKLCGSPWKLGKYSLIEVRFTFSSSKSVLFKKRITETFTKNLLFTIVSNISHDSTSLLVILSSMRT